jgi:subtilisin family serine protease
MNSIIPFPKRLLERDLQDDDKDNEPIGLFLQIASTLAVHDHWLKIFLGHDFLSGPLIVSIPFGGAEYEARKLYDLNGCAPPWITVPPYVPELSDSKELLALKLKMANTFLIKGLSDKSLESLQAAFDFLNHFCSVNFVQFDYLIKPPVPVLPKTADADRQLGLLPQKDPAELACLQDGHTWAVCKIKALDAAGLAGDGDGVVVAVIDSGIELDHPGLDANILRDSNNVKMGYDFSNCDGDPSPFDFHGTHCAGIIASKSIAYGSIKIVGVAPKAKILPIKIQPNSSDSVCARALVFTAQSGKAKVLNNSWEPGAPNSTDKVLKLAVDYAYLKRCIVVFAAGNQTQDISNYSPANYAARVISVAATTEFDNRADFSNYGAVTIAAPGEDIESLILNKSHGPDSGTSMACAYVSGVIALMLKVDPTLTFETIKSIIRDKADIFSSPDLQKPIGPGRINALACVQRIIKGS